MNNLPTTFPSDMVFVTSSDGARIYAEATGDPTKPALVLASGYTLSTVVFDKQFQDEELKKELYLVCTFVISVCWLTLIIDTIRYARAWSKLYARNS